MKSLPRLEPVSGCTAPARRGRPAKARVNPAELEVLGIPEALALFHQLGRRISRAVIKRAVISGALKAHQDTLCHDRLGQPLLKFYRTDLDAFWRATLQPVSPKILPLNEKGPLHRAL